MRYIYIYIKIQLNISIYIYTYSIHLQIVSFSKQSCSFSILVMKRQAASSEGQKGAIPKSMGYEKTYQNGQQNVWGYCHEGKNKLVSLMAIIKNSQPVGINRRTRHATTNREANKNGCKWLSFSKETCSSSHGYHAVQQKSWQNKGLLQKVFKRLTLW